MTRYELKRMINASQRWGFKKMPRLHTYRRTSYQQTILAAVSGEITVMQLGSIAKQLESLYEQRPEV